MFYKLLSVLFVSIYEFIIFVVCILMNVWDVVFMVEMFMVKFVCWVGRNCKFVVCICG